MARVAEDDERAFAELVRRYPGPGDEPDQPGAERPGVRGRSRAGSVRPGVRAPAELPARLEALDLGVHDRRESGEERDPPAGAAPELVQPGRAAGDAEGQRDACWPTRPRASERALEREQLQEAVGRAIATVPEKYRLALVLRDIEGLAYEEIAQVLGIPGGTVRSRINRARSMLKRKLQPLTTQGRDAMNCCDRPAGCSVPTGTTRSTQAEREWLEAHFAVVRRAAAREYEEFARTLEVVGVAAARRGGAGPRRARAGAGAPRRAGARPRCRSARPALGAGDRRGGAAAAIAGTMVLAVDRRSRRGRSRRIERRGRARAGAGATPAGSTAAAAPPVDDAGAERELSPRRDAAVADSLFDHSEDVEFILDPVTLRRGRAHAVAAPARAGPGRAGRHHVLAER